MEMSDFPLRILDMSPLLFFSPVLSSSHRTLPSPPRCQPADETLTCSSGGVFIVIFVGIALACITLLGEYWYYKYWKPSRMTSPTQNPKILAVKPDPATNMTNFNTEYK